MVCHLDRLSDKFTASRKQVRLKRLLSGVYVHDKGLATVYAVC